MKVYREPKTDCESFESYDILHFVADVIGNSADVAQLVEHVLGKDEVIGSIPIVGSR